MDRVEGSWQNPEAKYGIYPIIDIYIIVLERCQLSGYTQVYIFPQYKKIEAMSTRKNRLISIAALKSTKIKMEKTPYYAKEFVHRNSALKILYINQLQGLRPLTNTRS